jgi:diguanylate cyclase (GGDEF)-like protein
MNSPTRLDAEKTQLLAALAITGTASGIWALARLSDVNRQNMLLGAAAAVSAVCVFEAARWGASKRALTGQTFVGMASGLALGVFALGVEWQPADTVIWLAILFGLIAIGSAAAAKLLSVSSALIVAIVIAIGAVSHGASAVTGVQAVAAGSAALALAAGITLADSIRPPSPVGMLFIGAAIASAVAAVRAERIWTTSTLLLIAAGFSLLLASPLPGSTFDRRTDDKIGDTTSSALELLAATTGAAAVVLGALDRTTFTWAVAGAVGAGICGLAFSRYETERANGLRLRRLEKAASEGRIDPLTSLANRREIEERLAIEAGRSLRFDHSLSLLVIDIDDFKAVNDRYGHAEGDRALRYLGVAVKQSIRSIDAAGRFGGEEFLVLLPETDLDGALVVAERIRSTVSGSGMFTVSIGAAELDRTNGSAGQLFAEADAALYDAKRNGKNRVVSAD